MRPIGVVSSERTEPVDDDWDRIPATITLLPPFDADSILGLDAFSHLEVVYLFDRVEPGDVHSGARVPRGNPAWPAVGIFAQRARNRPNRLGSTICPILRCEGRQLFVVLELPLKNRAANLTLYGGNLGRSPPGRSYERLI